MVFQKLNINIYHLIVFFFLFSLTPQKNFSQHKYNFDFDSGWSWEDLINKVVLLDPRLIKPIDDLKKKISIDDARIVLKQLSLLDGLQDLKKLSQVSNFDSSGTIKWDSVFNKSFDSLIISENFSGLMESVIRLADVKAHNCQGDIFGFKGRKYFLQPVKRLEREFEIDFDYEGAERVLNYFEGAGFPEDIFEAQPYKQIITQKNTRYLNKDFLKYNLTEATSENPLLSIYKWVNPRCLWNFGGVSVYKKELREVLKTIRENENNIRFEIENSISKYLPDGIFLNTGIFFLFGKNNPGWVYPKNRLAIDLEYFGDDYSYLVRYIIHQVYKIALKEIHLPVEEYVVDSKDIDLIKLLSSIWEQGSANYVGPIGSETRPWNLLEKDFELFNKTFSHIKKRNSRTLIDSLINMGYSGNAPFYTMSTQMAYIIETTLGRSALIESIRFGPVSFFSQYIRAYREYPDRIRKVFTFPEIFEKKISELKILFPEDILKSALELKNFRDQPASMEGQIQKFYQTYVFRNSNGLFEFLTAQLLLESDQFEKAEEYFLKGLREKKDKTLISGMIGKSFLKRDALLEALYFFNLFIQTSPDDNRAYEMRGEFYYETGQLTTAKEDFQKALLINPGSDVAEDFLLKIDSGKY